MSKRTKTLILSYLVLWTLTWTVGNYQASTHFHKSTKKAETGKTIEVDFTQINENYLPINVNGYYRSKSISISPIPFLLIYKCSYQTHSLAGFGGIQGNFWFFGYSYTFPIYAVWVSSYKKINQLKEIRYSNHSYSLDT